MTRLALLGTAVAAVAALSLPALSPAAASRAKTKLTISASTFEGENTFSGFVTSKRQSCHVDRKVYVYEQVGRSRSLRRDELIGTDRATPNGPGSQYRVDTAQGGRFYAYAKATRRCNAAFSKTVRPPEVEEEEETLEPEAPPEG
jgi:hypothetical protein